MTDSIQTKSEWSFIRIVKGLGPAYIPIVVIAIELTAWALLMRHEVVGPYWGIWRFVLLLSLISVGSSVAEFFEKKSADDYYFASFCLLPWFLLILATPLLSFITFDFSFLNIKVLTYIAGMSFVIQFVTSCMSHIPE